MMNSYGYARAKARSKKNQARKASQPVKQRKEHSEPQIIYADLSETEYIPMDFDWSTTDEPAKALVERLDSTNFQLLSMPTGVGKTAICVRALSLLQQQQGSPLSFLVIVSRAIKEQQSWQQTLVNWNHDHEANDALHPLLIDTYDRFANILADARSLRKLLTRLTPNTVLVLDEVHKYKNPTSKRAKQLQKLHHLKRIGLSATPLTNNLVMDGASYLIMNNDFPNKTQFLGKTGLDRRIGEHGQFLIYDDDGLIDQSLWPYWPRFKDQLAKVIYRPSVDLSTINMPNVHEKLIQLESNDALHADLASLQHAMQKRAFDSMTDYLLEVAYRIATDEQRIERICECCVGQVQPLIFYLHVDVGTAYEKALLHRGYHPQRIDGSHSIEQVDLLSDEPILVQYQAGSEGIEMKHSTCSIFAQNQYSYSLLVQARGRNVRRAMQHDVTQYSLVADEHFDQAVFERVMSREELSEALLIEIATEND